MTQDELVNDVQVVGHKLEGRLLTLHYQDGSTGYWRKHDSVFVPAESLRPIGFGQPGN